MTGFQASEELLSFSSALFCDAFDFLNLIFKDGDVFFSRDGYSFQPLQFPNFGICKAYALGRSRERHTEENE